MQARTLQRLVVLVGAVVFVDTMFYATVAPLVPHFTRELGISKASAGILVGAFAAGTIVGSLPGGWLTGRLGPKATVLVALVVVSVASVVFGLGRHILVLDAARFVQGLGSACSWAAALAWLAEAAPDDRRGELIGAAVAAAVGGTLLGPVLGALADQIGVMLVFGAVPVVCAVLGLAVWRTPAPPRVAVESGARLWPALRRPAVVLGMWLVALPSLSFGAILALVPLRLDALGAGSVAVGVMFLVAAGFEASVSPLVGRLSDRRGRLVPIRWGLLVGAAVALVLPWLGQPLAIAALVVLAGGVMGMFWAPAMALLSEAGDVAGLSLGIGFALSNLAWSGGQTVGAIAGGGLAAITSDAVPYTLVALAFLVSLGLLVRRRRASPVGV